MAKVGITTTSTGTGWPRSYRPAVPAAARPTVPARPPAAPSAVERRRGDRAAWSLAAAVGAVILAWAGLNLGVEGARFDLVSDDAATGVGVEAASALARFFGALVLLVLPDPTPGRRLRWVAAGIVALGLGGLGFGYVPTLIGWEIERNTLVYASLAVWTLAGALFAVGLVPRATPRPTLRLILVVLVAIEIGAALAVERLPALVRSEGANGAEGPLMPGLTGWHWALSAVPLGLALAATVGAVRYAAAEGLGRWLIVAMTLLVGSQIHNLFWPSAYSPVLTTADLLRLGFAAAVVVGGIVALRRVAAERAVALEAEQEASRRLAELALIRADFSAMVAHELGSPLAAVRRSADVLGTEPLGPIQADAVATIRAEAQVLAGLIADVQTMATVERDDFAVAPFPVAIDLLLADAVAIAKGLPGEHPVACAFNRRERVLADPERIGQVLRNLLGNAAKYSPPGSPIEVRTERRGGRVRVEVVDQGYGIHPDDLARVFEKFGRGRDAEGRRVPGVGLGLYLTRRILQAHGSDLTVSSTLGQGSTFAFELEVAG